jgi:Protein of unknown function (DUF3105)
MADARKPKTKPNPGAAARQKPASKGKLAKGAAARRQAERRRRQRALLWSGAVVVVIAALVGVIVWQGRGDNDRVDARTLAAARQEAGCSDVKQFPQAGRTHIPPSQQPRNWNSNPPTSGDHLAVPLQPGAYDAEQDERAVVHNLEHGYVVIQYKNLPADQVAELRKFVQDRRGSKLVLTPYSGLPSDGVALTAWQHLETCQRANLDVVKAFVADYMLPGGRRSVAPEPFGA